MIGGASRRAVRVGQRGVMQKGENVISVALAAVVMITIVAIQRKWNPASLKQVASSAENFILTTTGIRGEVPDIAGYEKVKTFRLGNYNAGLYRASPAPLIFAPGRFVIYNHNNQPVFKMETLEGSKEPWTEVYDFTGRAGLPIPGSRRRPEYLRDLSGNGTPDIIVGKYSGGDHCCTLATVVELGNQGVKVLGRVDGLDGLPFKGLGIRRLNKDSSWELVAHRSYLTGCGTHDDAADVLSVYSYMDGAYSDQTAQFGNFLDVVLRQNLARWRREKARSLGLLQTIATDYATLGQGDEGRRFFAMNLNPFIPRLREQGVDPNACLDDVSNLIARLTNGTP
jgi:hypothetical protein